MAANMLTGGLYGLANGDSPQDYLLNTATGGMYTGFKEMNNTETPQKKHLPSYREAYEQEQARLAQESELAKAEEKNKKDTLREQMLGAANKDDDTEIGDLS